MGRYKVLSDNFGRGTAGDVLDDDDLDGVNVAVAVAGGHLAEVTAGPPARKAGGPVSKAAPVEVGPDEVVLGPDEKAK